MGLLHAVTDQVYVTPRFSGKKESHGPSRGI